MNAKEAIDYIRRCEGCKYDPGLGYFVVCISDADFQDKLTTEDYERLFNNKTIGEIEAMASMIADFMHEQYENDGEYGFGPSFRDAVEFHLEALAAYEESVRGTVDDEETQTTTMEGE